MMCQLIVACRENPVNKDCAMNKMIKMLNQQLGHNFITMK